MKQITLAELQDMFGHNPKIDEFSKKADYLVVFENQQFDSSSFGLQTCVLVGPAYTYKTLAQVESSWLNDLPSQRQYPTYYMTCKEEK